MIYGLIISIFILILIIFPLSVRVMGFLDPKNNRLFYSLRVIKFLKIQSGYLTLKRGKLYVQTTKDELKHLNLSDIKNVPIKIDSSILKLISLKKFNFFIEIGVGESVFGRIFSTVPVNIISDFLADYLKKNFKGISVNKYFIYRDDKFDFQLSIDGVIKISIANLIYVTLKGYFKKLKEKNNGRNKESKKQNRRGSEYGAE